jgi:dihydrofolate synthase/folylpolyglutamate synthase
MTEASTLQEWLAHCERAHPKTIDLTLERVCAVRDRLGLRFGVPVVAVAGTNGKGSSCAMLEAIALHAGYRVGLYSSPHLINFEERCRINGSEVAAAGLLPHFAAVEAARGAIGLTYFEFTTLAILRALAQAELDLVILEVGLGGRFDAVNAIDADCALITSIDLDHMEYLGPDREAIGFEKAGILRPGRPAVISDPMPPASVLRHAQQIGADLWQAGVDFGHAGDRQQWSWQGRGRRYHALAYPALRGANQLLNASGVLAVFAALQPVLPISAQAVRLGLATVQLQGRFQIVPGQPVVVLDVAHNPQAAATLAYNLDQMGFYPRNHAVFGAMRDKDIGAMAARLAPLIDSWYLCALPLDRAASCDELALRLQPQLRPGAAAPSRHATPSEALRAAMGAADPADRIVVFGSFLCVGGVLKDGIPHTRTAHSG